MQKIWQDLSLSALVAGFVTVLVGFTSSVAIIFQAAQTLGADAAQLSSWMWALGLGMGLTSIGLSLYYKTPIATAWSTPGAAMLIVSGAGVAMPAAIGAFMVAGLLIALVGFTGWFDRLLQHLPPSLAAAMLAGILLQFGLQAFSTLQAHLLLGSLMLLAYILVRPWAPRTAVPLALVMGMLVANAEGLLSWQQISLHWAKPVWITPIFDVAAVLNLALPLFVVTMTSQNAPGAATLRAAGYQPPISNLIGWTGIATVLLAPFGCFALNLAAITAAICLGRDAHPDPEKRYIAAVFAGVFYCLVGLAGASVISLFSAMPGALIALIAGLALLSTIGQSLANALQETRERDAALLTFLVTASGISLLGISAACWGLLLGVAARAYWSRK
ncbi:benzoate/H(+) symporter BenE family transporter [Parvibium lacunae]|uniref:Benzoate transporter n=1 Tax=Parvibium lacunae TaxID=1888893 RepID=A0A368KZU7_9BURK|nr:benzoate/H(+) symporter BenE family transporter [Parvibium lacunae]RCS56836.1 hypothetical protein DU000_10875 [Parvibium lacunae]